MEASIQKCNAFDGSKLIQHIEIAQQRMSSLLCEPNASGLPTVKT